MEKLSLIKRQILPLSNTDFFHTKNMGIFYHSFFIIAIFFSQKIATFLKKYQTHHYGKLQNNVSDFLLKFLARLFQKATKNKAIWASLIAFNCYSYLLASSIATATATVIHSLWVVTCADQTHHFNAY